VANRGMAAGSDWCRGERTRKMARLETCPDIRTIAREIYRAKDIAADTGVRDQLAQFEQMGFGNLPVCIAKTQYSFSTNAELKGAPTDHVIPVREVWLSAGAEFVVAVCGEIMTMPGLPKVPAANSIDLGADGRITGLF
jgi:formate--tetrahydrofolate ligase